MRTSSRILLGAIIFMLFLYLLSKIQFAVIFSILTTIKLRFFIIAFAIYSLAILIFIARTMISLRKIITPHFWFFLETGMAGFFINAITPGSQVGGEPVRAYYLAKRYNKPKTKVFGAILADRIMHGSISFFFVIASLLFVLTYIPVSDELKIIFQTVLFFLLAFLAAIIWFNTKRSRFSLKKILQRLKIFQKIKKIKILKQAEKHFGNFTSSFRKTIFDKETLFFGLTFSLAHWLLVYLSSYFIFLALGVHISFFLVIVVFCLGSLVGEFSPTPGGVGIVEGFMIFFYSLVGINLEIAVVAAVLIRAIGYFYSLIIGSICLLHLEKKLG